MEQFKFLKPTMMIHNKFLDEFERKFSDIADDKLLFLTRGRYGDTDLTSIEELIEMGFDVEHDLKLMDYDKKEYYRKYDKYKRFIAWAEDQIVDYTPPVIGEVQCPYLGTKLGPIYLNRISDVAKRVSNLKAKPKHEGILGDECVASTLTPRSFTNSVFKSNDLLDYMDPKIVDILMLHWGYDVTDMVSLNELEDNSVIAFTRSDATVYYAETNQTFKNKVYIGPKGLYVKKKGERLMISTPHYPDIDVCINKLVKGDIDYVNDFLLPSQQTRIYNAAVQGSLPASLTGKPQSKKEAIVAEIRDMLATIDSNAEAYERIARLMK